MTTTSRNYSKTATLALCGLFAAVTAVCSWISIPLGFTPVPVNLATLAVFLAGGLLGPKYGSISLSVFVLLGAVGAPVFSGFRGGLSVLAGPTGGYLIGYIAAATIIGALCFLVAKATRDTKKLLPIYGGSMVLGLAACYLLGTVWFVISTGTGIVASLMMCVVPFLIGDGLKIIAASLLLLRLKKYI